MKLALSLDSAACKRSVIAVVVEVFVFIDETEYLVYIPTSGSFFSLAYDTSAAAI
jgi:hypothetical protein